MTALVNSIPKVYDPSKVIMVIAGVAPTDVAPDTMYMLSKEEDLITPSVGVLGEVALAINRNTTGTLTISLKNTSDYNAALAGIVQAASISGIPFFPVALTDPSLGMSMVTSGWIQSQPDYTAGKEVGTMDWVFGLANVEFLPIA